MVFSCENEAEYGNPLADNSNSLRDKSYYTMNNFNDMWIAGLPVQELIENYNISKKDLMPYLPISSEELSSTNIQIHYLGYYLKWVPQEAYYYAVENSGFKARPLDLKALMASIKALMTKLMTYIGIQLTLSLVLEEQVMMHLKKLETIT